MASGAHEFSRAINKNKVSGAHIEILSGISTKTMTSESFAFYGNLLFCVCVCVHNFSQTMYK